LQELVGFAAMAVPPAKPAAAIIFPSSPHTASGYPASLFSLSSVGQGQSVDSG
jgi:hypothetical protein